MMQFILKKLGYGLLVLFGVSTVVFLIFSVLPGDAAQMTLGQRSDVSSLESVKKELGLDKPKYLQYLYFLNDISPISLHKPLPTEEAKYRYVRLAGNTSFILVIKYPYLRRSYQTKREVSHILTETVPNTLLLTLGAMAIATLLGVTLGTLSSIKPDSPFDRFALGFSVLGVSAPSFFAGIVVAWLFGFVLHRYTGLNMTGSLFTYDPFQGPVLELKNLILPTLTLGLRPLAIIVQLTRSSMLDVLNEDYIRTARAKGLNEQQVIVKHALKNALNPVITAISGWFASLMAGSFFIEYIFGYNGLGKATVDALEQADFPVVMGAILFIASIFILINLFVDILYGLLDPRVVIG